MALLTAVSGAEADVSIEWVGPVDCAVAEVQSEIARLLPDGSSATIHALVNVAHTHVWSAHVRLEAEASVLGERTFEAESCDELRGAVALLIVLAIDPNAVLATMDPSQNENESGETTQANEVPEEPGEPVHIDESGQREGQAVEAATELGQPENTAASPESVAPESVPHAAETSESNTRAGARARTRELIESPHWGIAASAGVSFGVLPAPSPVFSLGVFHQRARFGVGIYAFAALPQDASTAVDASGRLALGAIRATPGLHLRYARLMLDVRAVVELGVMAGRGRDVAGPQTGYSLWAALGAEAGVSVRIGPISLGFRGDIRVPLNRPLYAFRGPLSVHRAASLVGRGEIAIGLHFL